MRDVRAYPPGGLGDRAERAQRDDDCVLEDVVVAAQSRAS